MHLKEASFCTPIVDQAAVEAKKKKELDEEVERVKKEYEEKQRKKKEKEEADKSKDKDKDKDKDKESEEKPTEAKKPDGADKVRASLSKSARDILKCLTPSQQTEVAQKEEEEPRVFALHRFVSIALTGIGSARALQWFSLQFPLLLMSIQIVLSKPFDHQATGRNGQTSSRTHAKSNILSLRTKGSSMRSRYTGSTCVSTNLRADTSADRAPVPDRATWKLEQITGRSASHICDMVSTSIERIASRSRIYGLVATPCLILSYKVPPVDRSQYKTSKYVSVLSCDYLQRGWASPRPAMIARKKAASEADCFLQIRCVAWSA